MVQHIGKICIIGAEELIFWLKLKIFTNTRLTLWTQESSRAGPRKLHELTKATALINEKNADALHPSLTSPGHNHRVASGQPPMAVLFLRRPFPPI